VTEFPVVPIGIDLGGRKVAMVGPTFQRHWLAPTTVRHSELAWIRNQVLSFLTAYESSHLVKVHLFIEEPLVAGVRNLRTSLMLAQTAGAVLSMGLDSTLVPVSSWKKKVLGNGSAKKEDVARWFKLAYPDSELHGNQDVCDAAAIFHYGVAVLEVAKQLRSGSDARRSRPETISEHGSPLA